MSGPIQNVYFTNPIVNSQIAALQNDAGYGQTISANGQSLVQDYIQTTYLGGSKVGSFFYGGNVKSDQEFFCQTGLANPSGAYNLDTICAWASASKTVFGLTMAKLIEEGILNPNQSIGDFGPDYQGIGYYYENIIVLNTGTSPYTTGPVPIPTNTGAFPYAANSWTGTIGTFDWGSVKIGDCMRLNVGLPNDVNMLAPVNWYWLNGINNDVFKNNVSNITITNGLQLQWATIQKSVAEAYTLQTGANTTFFGWYWAINNPANFNLTNAVLPTLNMNRSGKLPCVFKPGTWTSDLGAYSLYGYPGNYDFGYWMLNDLCDRLTRYYVGKSLSEYINEKIFTPLGMTRSYVFPQTSPSPSDTNTLQSTFQRATVPFFFCYQRATYDPNNWYTWDGFRLDPNYAAASTGVPNGIIAWASQYPQDLMYRFNILTYQPQLLPNLISSTNAPLVGEVSQMSIRDFGKIMKLLANKGAYKDSNGKWQRLIRTESWNYLISPKVPSNTYQVSVPSDFDKYTRRNSAMCLGVGRTNRDLTQDLDWGVADDSTLFWGGNTAHYLVDFYTGNWCFLGSNTAGGQATFSPSNSQSDLLQCLRRMTSP